MRKYTTEQQIKYFWDKVDKNGIIPTHYPELGACWEWTSWKEKGYGKFRLGDKTRVGTHRFAWILAFGEIPDGLCVLHKCDNPACVNPSHLFLGTQQDNVADKVIKDRQAKHEKHGRHKLTLIEVEEIRQRYAMGEISQDKLAKIYGVSQGTIHFIIKHKHWK